MGAPTVVGGLPSWELELRWWERPTLPGPYMNGGRDACRGSGVWVGSYAQAEPLPSIPVGYLESLVLKYPETILVSSPVSMRKASWPCVAWSVR